MIHQKKSIGRKPRAQNLNQMAISTLWHMAQIEIAKGQETIDRQTKKEMQDKEKCLCFVLVFSILAILAICSIIPITTF